MSLLEFKQKLPVKTVLGEGYVLYVETGGAFSNDLFTVALDDGTIKHFLSSQLLVVPNGTLGIKPDASFVRTEPLEDDL